jgi:hypothetical protein
VDTDCNEIFKNSCNPAFISINSKLQSQGEVLTEANKKLDKLMTVVCLGNGKPALTERIAVLETIAHAPRQQAQSSGGASGKRIAFGPLKIDGYNARDAATIALGLAFAVMMWMHWQGVQERSRLAQEAENDRKTLTVRVAELTQLVTGRAQGKVGM